MSPRSEYLPGHEEGGIMARIAEHHLAFQAQPSAPHTPAPSQHYKKQQEKKEYIHMSLCD